MSNTSPPLEAQRFGRSQTPESPRPVHIPEPANIPVLLNQMDPVFNDTATYNIPHNQTFSPFPDPTSEQGPQSSGVDEQDAVQNFFREAEHQAAGEPEPEPSVRLVQNPFDTASNTFTGANSFPSVPLADKAVSQQEQDSNALATQSTNPSVPGATASDDTASAEGHNQSNVPHVDQSAGNEANTGPSQPPEQQVYSNGVDPVTGVDYQSLLDTIAQSASTAPSANALTASTTSASNTEDTSRPIPSVPGLPPKPPPQARPVEFPSYSSYNNDAARIGAQESGTQAQSGINDIRQAGLSDPLTTQHVTPSIYHPLPSFNPHNQPQISKPPGFPLPPELMPAPGQDMSRSQDPAERPWSPRTQSEYDQFLEDERRYVTDGIWDKFPMGSRLFVGNLPSEKVTKRDLFHKFHKHGQLAQISIKQAYGFVQFLEAASCLAALNAEQGVEIRGRKVHLEISKPQKNTRNAGTNSGAGGANSSGNKNQQRRRSRSPDRNPRRDNRNYSDSVRDEPVRRRDEYRSRRSSSPRGYRQRENYTSNGRDARSRSPFYGHAFIPPPTPAMSDEASLQLPRRDPRQVPDVQLLVLEPEVVQSYINWVEQGFRNKGLQASTIWVHNRFPLQAVVTRQIIEGVQAVVKLTRASQNNSKISLQIFDRSGGSNVTFQEYADLDIWIAADMVISARQKERGGYSSQGFQPPAPTFSSQGYSTPTQYGANQPPVPFPQPTPPQYQVPQHGQTMPYSYAGPQQGGFRPPSQPPTPTGHPPNLQQLLANLRQPQNAAATAQNGQSVNLAGYVGNPGAPQQYQSAQPTAYGAYNSGSQQQGGQQNVQNVMEQLARYQR